MCMHVVNNACVRLITQAGETHNNIIDRKNEGKERNKEKGGKRECLVLITDSNAIFEKKELRQFLKHSF